MSEEKAMDRLPRWARDEIQRLRSDLEDSNKRLRAAFGETPTKVEVDPHRHMDGDDRRVFLPDYTLVRFTIKSGETIDVHLRDGLLEVRGSGTRISVLPRAANVVQIASVE